MDKMKDGIIRYPMRSNKDRPIFEYLVKSSMEFEYWLFKDFNSAVECAKKLNREHDEMIIIYDYHFNTRTREYQAQKTFWVWHNGELVFDKHGDVELHLEFYINAGEWMNPNQEWIDQIRRRWEREDKEKLENESSSNEPQ